MFATDAQGSGEGDCGGYGIVGRKIDETDFNVIVEAAELPGRNVRRLGDFSGTKHPDNLEATVPISMLPDRIFDESHWKVISHGRWKHDDHITIRLCEQPLNG